MITLIQCYSSQLGGNSPALEIKPVKTLSCDSTFLDEPQVMDFSFSVSFALKAAAS